MGVTLGSAVIALRDYLLHGGTVGTNDNAANGEQAFETLLKGLAGDYVIVCDPATTTPEPTSEAWTQEVVVTLETADGEVHTWYNGPIKLAIDDTSIAGTASIDPAAGEHNMTNGKLTVTVSGDAKDWLNGDTVTLTVSDPDTSGFGGWTASDATFVATFTTP